SCSGDEITWDAEHTFLVEQLLEGQEFSAEIVVREEQFFRIALFHKFLINRRGFLECGFTLPPLDIVKGEEERIWRYIEHCLQALGVNETTAHVEVMLTPSGPVLIEANVGRAGGQILAKAVKQATGVDLRSEVVAAYAQLPRPQPDTPTFTGQITTLTI